MVKIFIFMVGVLVSSQSAFAWGDSCNQENFDICARSDYSWMSRWGQYLVAYDYYYAQDICNRSPGNGSSAVAMGCYVGGQWLQAGYYCSDNSGSGGGSY